MSTAVIASPGDSESSPRSTILTEGKLMTSNITSMNKSNLTGELDVKVTNAPKENPSTPPDAPGGKGKASSSEPGASEKLKGEENPAHEPLQQGYVRQQPNYWYNGHPNGAPPSPSPGMTAYESNVTSFMQPQFAPSPFPTPGSPARTAASVMIPPASPLFPESSSPSLPPYMNSPAPLNYTRSQAGGSTEEHAWDQHGYPSPQLYAMPRPGRAYSFEGEGMLPPAATGEEANAAFAYSTAASPQTPAGAVFQPWSYPSPPPDMYAAGAPGSPLQPRPVYGRMPYYHQYPATSPGPPIQTANSNKGPDGANLFIFHIPNHFTNLDMYNLFCHYGNLLSVRIMVEKETGRSRGFGFVSYDNPDSAAMAIKELNGYAIGNKRLKVQHKQIRPRDLHPSDHQPYQGDGNFAAPAFPLPTAPGGWMEGSTQTAAAVVAATSEEAPIVEDPLNNMGSLQAALPEEPEPAGATTTSSDQ